jgi:hypothetical protein
VRPNCPKAEFNDAVQVQNSAAFEGAGLGGDILPFISSCRAADYRGRKCITAANPSYPSSTIPLVCHLSKCRVSVSLPFVAITQVNDRHSLRKTFSYCFRLGDTLVRDIPKAPAGL